MDIKPTYEELMERVNRLENLIENVGSSMMVFDYNGKLLMINKSAASYLGGRPEDFIGREIGDIFHKNSEEFLRRIHEVYKSGKPSSFENQLVLTSGISWFLSRYIPLVDGNQTVYAVQIVAIDITDRKKTEDALKETEEIFSCFMEHNPIYVFFKDENIRSIRLSKNYEQLLGMPMNEILGKTMDDIFPSDLAKGMIEDDKRVFREGKQITVEEEFNGRFYETIKFPISYEGKPKYLAGYTMDITEQKKTKEKLESNIAFLQKLLDTIPNPIFYIDKEGCYQGGNRALTDGIFGMKAEDIIGHPIYKLCEKITKETADEHSIKDLELIKTGGTQIYESKMKCNDGKERDFVFYKSTFPNAEGETAGIVGVMLDITDRKRAEKEKTVLQLCLQQAQKMESIGTLAGGIAHDFNNILMPILAYSELATMKLPPDSPIQHDINQIHKAAERARDLVRQILTFARQEEKERIPIKISQIVNETIKLLRSSIPTTIDIRHDISLEYDMVLADPTQINQIIMNLSTNAVHAMEDNGGTLELIIKNEDVDSESAKGFSGMEPGRYLKLTVKDTGHGIIPQLREKIFEPYFTTKGPGKGTGMGLSIVHGIVKKYGGEIIVESEVYKGTSFHVYLPVFEADDSSRETVKDSEHLPKGLERILVVDDEKVSLDAIQSMLEWLGYKVTSRTSSVEALEAFRYNPEGFDLVITDHTMPNMTGKSLARELMAIRQDIPVILCTGFSEQIDEKRARELGIRAFIMKPIVLGQISKVIRDVLDKL
jgi:PAS domain S-box-containing protein